MLKAVDTCAKGVAILGVDIHSQENRHKITITTIELLAYIYNQVRDNSDITIRPEYHKN